MTAQLVTPIVRPGEHEIVPAHGITRAIVTEWVAGGGNAGNGARRLTAFVLEALRSVGTIIIRPATRDGLARVDEPGRLPPPDQPGCRPYSTRTMPTESTKRLLSLSVKQIALVLRIGHRGFAHWT
jgi:hypothetical protein